MPEIKPAIAFDTSGFEAQSLVEVQDSLQAPGRRRDILAAFLGIGCGACGFPDVLYDGAPADGGITDASVDVTGDSSADASAVDATGRDGNAADASDAGTTTDASANDGGAADGDAQVDAEAGAIGPALGSASTFAILAGTTVTNTGESFFMGDLGVSPGDAVTGITPEMVTGTVHGGDTVAQMAERDLASAYDELRGMDCPSGSVLSGDLGARTLVPGVYCFPAAAASLTGKLVLDAMAEPSALFVFQVGGALSAAADAEVEVIHGGSGCNVFWQVASSATIGASSNFAGSILAATSITLSAGVLLDGRALAQSGAVTIDTTHVAFVSACP